MDPAESWIFPSVPSSLALQNVHAVLTRQPFPPLDGRFRAVHFQLTSPHEASFNILLPVLVNYQHNHPANALCRNVGLWWYSKSCQRITAFNKSPYSIIHRITISVHCRTCDSSSILPGHLGLYPCKTPTPRLCCCPMWRSHHGSSMTNLKE